MASQKHDADYTFVSQNGTWKSLRKNLDSFGE